MAFHLIVTCVSKKKKTGKQPVPSIIDPSIEPGKPEKVFPQWKRLISECSLPPKRAIDLYSGPLWKAYRDSWKLLNSADCKSHLWILSAGYGFIGAEEEIKPYDITFQGRGEEVPSVLAKISDGDEAKNKKQLLQKWWGLDQTPLLIPDLRFSFYKS